jgi:exodeoxyribonuclease V alpha subunit
MNDEADHPQPATDLTGPAPDADALSEGFASWVARWARDQAAPAGAVDLTRVAAAQLSLATSAGHVCLGLDTLARLGPAAAQDPAVNPISTALRGVVEGAPDGAAIWRTALLACGVVGTPAQPGARPMILDDGGRLYLHRYFDLERRLAHSLRLRAAPIFAPLTLPLTVPPTLPFTAPLTAPLTAVDGAAAPDDAGGDTALKALLAAHFPRPAGDAASPAPADLVDWQQVATAAALTGRLTVISGGPGTGKTTVVVKLLACLLTQDPGCRIALAAPTGKAAARLLEALRTRAAGLPTALRERLPVESYTLHRLLGLGPGGGRPHHGADSAAPPLLPYDALVVDEASMLDLALATRLFEALAPQARLILLGDKDQLAAVEAGAVFAELSARRHFSAAGAQRLAALCDLPVSALSALNGPAANVGPEPGAAAAQHGLADQVIWFTRQHRFAADSGIGRLAAALQHGQVATAMQVLRDGPGGGVCWLDDGPHTTPSGLGSATEQALQDGYADYLAALQALVDMGDGSVASTVASTVAGSDGGSSNPRIAVAMAAFDRFRVLCAVRDGPRGLAAVNLAMERHLRLQTSRWAPPHLSAAASASASVPPARRALAMGPEDGIASAWYVGRPVMIRRNDRLLGLFNGDIGLCLPDAEGRLQVWFADRAAGADALSPFRPIAPVRLPPHDTAFAITVHQSQGSEFDRVLVLLPGDAGRAVTRELLYTAVTRARQQVTLSGPAAVLARAIQTPTARRSGLWARWAEAGG